MTVLFFGWNKKGSVWALLIDFPLSSSLLTNVLLIWSISVLMGGNHSKLSTEKIGVEMSKNVFDLLYTQTHTHTHTHTMHQHASSAHVIKHAFRLWRNYCFTALLSVWMAADASLGIKPRNVTAGVGNSWPLT